MQAPVWAEHWQVCSECLGPSTQCVCGDADMQCVSVCVSDSVESTAATLRCIVLQVEQAGRLARAGSGSKLGSAAAAQRAERAQPPSQGLLEELHQFQVTRPDQVALAALFERLQAQLSSSKQQALHQRSSILQSSLGGMRSMACQQQRSAPATSCG
jgi:hypothetical protein